MARVPAKQPRQARPRQVRSQQDRQPRVAKIGEPVRQTEAPKVRHHFLDIMRLLAIGLMLFAHVTSYFYAGNNPLVTFWRDWGNIVCFTTFLFVSGAVQHLAYLANPKEGWRRKLLIRSGYLLASYYFLALLVLLPQIITSQGPDWIAVLRVVALVDVPGYTEFLLPFVIYSLVICAFPGIIKRIVKSVPLLLIAIAITYVLGELGYQALLRFELPELIERLLSLFVGGEGLYRFPLLQYAPVMLIGMHWGVIISDSKETEAELKREVGLVLIVFVIAGLALYLGGSDYFFRRWPPSLGFLSMGMVWVGMLLLLFQKIPVLSRKLVAAYQATRILPSFSSSALVILVVHTTLLTLFAQAGLQPTTSAVPLLALFIVSVVVAILGTAVFQMLPQFYTSHHSRNFYVLVFGLGLLATSGVILTAAIPAPAGGGGARPDNIRMQTPFWFSDRHPYYKQLEISSNTLQNLAENDAISFEFNHKELVAAHQSTEAGTDLMLAFWNGREYRRLSIALESANTEKAKLLFKLAEAIPSGRKSSDYYLYYGDRIAKAETNQFGQVTARVAAREVSEMTIPFHLQPKNFWRVTGDKLQLEFTLPDFTTESDSVSVQIYSAADLSKPKLSRNLNWDPDRNYLYEIELKDFAYGDYYSQVTVLSANPDDPALRGRYANYSVGEPFKDKFISNRAGFRYSAPLFMTWTIDWEGYDLRDSYQEGLADISKRYGMPMTHFFNPRIYTNPAISPARAQTLTNWVKARQSMGDEVSLHLHMHLDMVAAAGLTPLTEPAWGGRTEGHDVLTTNYDYAQFRQILSWSKAKFVENGLEVPKGYRAGGWFLDIENLRALNDEGFTYDSSGSDFKEPYGPNRQPRSWNLTPTTRPYRPSFNDQNRSVQPLLKIWEYPNNGADSTNRTADELLRRLRLNLPGMGTAALSEPQVLTYLTHPHWLDTIDKPKLEILFTEAEKYKYANDNGPVIYLTQIEAHNRYLSLL
jgi:hypothetical protein